MSGNTFGTCFRVTTFGESHGAALGAVIEGCPAGLRWDEKLLYKELERRRPGGALVSARSETDRPEILSGVFGGKTLGTPIAIMIRNVDQRSADYKGLKARAGHADTVWKSKFGHSDPRGGGRSSGRETVSRVAAGAVAQMLVRRLAPGIVIKAFASQIGPFELPEVDFLKIQNAKARYPADRFAARFPSSKQHQVAQLLTDAKSNGKSYGGTAALILQNVPKNLGQPVFRKIKADFASAFLSLGATAGFEVGAGFSSTTAEGSHFHASGKKQYGGIQGGITTGADILLRVAFKPTSSVLEVAKKGRHDPCIVPRAIPVLEAMVWLVLADHLLMARLDRI